MDESGPKSTLDRITTQWPLLQDPTHFVLRYGPAIRKYLEALLRNGHDAEEVAQEFLLRVVERGFDRASPDQGRFRYYLKTAVRNAAISFLRKKRARPQGAIDPAELPAPDEPTPAADEEWKTGWRRCVLDRAWRALEAHERDAPKNLFHSVLRLSAENPQADSESLAERVGLRGAAFRKQLSRARRFFAGLVLDEVKETLEQPTPERVEDELIDLGLMRYVRRYLPRE